MKSAKHIELLKTFSKEELILFNKFIESPYFNMRELKCYYDILKKHYPDFPADKISREKIFSKLFPGEKFNEKKVINLNNRLVKLIEEFFIHISLGKSSYYKHRFLIDELFRRKKNAYALKELNEFENEINKSKSIGEKEILFKREIEKCRAEISIEQHDFQKVLESKKNMQEYLSTIFYIKMLEHMRDKIIAKNVYNSKSDSSFLKVIETSTDFDKLMNFLENEDDKHSTSLKISYLVYKTFSEPEYTEHYYKLKKLIIDNFNSFSRIEKYYSLSELMTYCTTKQSEEFQKEMFDNIKFAFKNNAYKNSDKDYYQVASFRNVLLTCISLGELDWLKDFVERYYTELKPEYRESMRNLSYAKIYFAKNEFEKSLDCVSKIQYDFFLYKLDVKDLLLMLYYELELYEQAFSLIDAYRHFLSRSKEYSKLQIEIVSAYLKNYNSLLKTKINNSENELYSFKKTIESAPNFHNRKWILRKIEELIDAKIQKQGAGR